MSETDMETVGWLISSQYRIDVCWVLSESHATPTGISDELDAEPSHVSRALHQLKDRDIVELLSEEGRRKGRIYGLTDMGRDVFETAEKVRK